MKAIRGDMRKAYDDGYNAGAKHVSGMTEQILTVLLSDKLGLNSSDIKEFIGYFLVYCDQIISKEVEFDEIVEVADEIKGDGELTTENIGIVLANIRIKQGLNQRELSDRSGISRSVISKVESGQTSPSINTLEKIADVLKLDVSVVVSGKRS